jgi:cysteinyl-tRNA synthetase
LEAYSYADTVLGLGFEHDDAMAKKLYEKDLGVEVAADDAPADIKALLEAREAARAAKDWAKADALRAELAEKGYKIEDGAGGARVVKMG